MSDHPEHAAVRARLELIAAAEGFDPALIGTISATALDVLNNSADDVLTDCLQGLAATQEAVEALFRAGGGRELSVDEAIEFITKPVYMGPPERIAAKPRGRKPKRTQYDVATDLRRPLYQRLVRMPENRRRAKATRSEAGDYSKALVLCAVEQLPNIPERKLASRIVEYLAKRGLKAGCESHVRDILKTLTKLGLR